MKTKKINKKAVSPLVATILLIGFTIVLVTLVIIWGKNYLEEKAQKEATLAKTQGECQLVEFKVEKATAGVKILLNIRNLKQTRIDGFIFRIGEEVVETGSKKEDGLSSLEHKENWPIDGLSATTGTIDIIPRLRAGKGYYVPCSGKIITVKIELQ